MASNDEAIESFVATGKLILELPELEAVQKFHGAKVRFRRPSDLFVRAGHKVTNHTVFKLWSVGRQFLLEVPRRKRESYYSFEGERIESVPFPVSPSDIVREMFLPEAWSTLGSSEVRIVKGEANATIHRMEIGSRSRPRRLVDVSLFGTESPAWVIVRSVLLDKSGRTVAITTMDEYILVNGIRFPKRVEASFPVEETRMALGLRSVRINEAIPDDTFDVEKQARKLGLLEESEKRAIE